MCMFDCDNVVTPVNDGEYRIARKEHRCAECHRAIGAGESYHYETFVNEGDFTQHKTCAHCMVARDWLLRECGGWVYGGVEEDLGEHVSESAAYYGMPLARIYVAMRHNWKRHDGTLRPIPAIPPTSFDKRAAAAIVRGAEA